jgi:NAD+ synthase
VKKTKGDYKMEKMIKLPYMNSELVAREIGDFVVENTRKFNYTGCVIGLSGGIDSTTTAALIHRAFEKHNSNIVNSKNRLELIGYIIPSKINSPSDTSDGLYVANKLGIHSEIVNIQNIVDAYNLTNRDAFNNKQDLGNLISRIRANVLSTKASTEKKILSGTGNKDEDFGVGYYTLFGDGAVHISPIGGLSKRLVREMATYLGIDSKLVYREPTAGLEIGQTDFKDLGYGYDIVELVTEGLSQGFSKQELKKNIQIIKILDEQLRVNTKFKNVDEVVSDILYRNSIAISKAEIIHPPSPNITLYYN